MIDVVLPVYNGAKHLRESIESVLSQEGIDFSFYILDDCSTDDSWEIIRSYHDPRIVSSRNESNRGLFPNLNFLCEMGEADLIKIWAQDDLMESNCLKEFFRYFRKYNFNFAYAASMLIDADGKAIEDLAVDYTPTEISPQLYRDICLFNGCISSNISNTAISRNAFFEFGKFREDFIASGDHEYWTRICLNRGAVKIPEKLLSIRVHSEQLSRSEKTAVAFAVEDFEITTTLWGACASERRIELAKSYYRKITLSYHFNTFFWLFMRLNIKQAFAMLRFLADKQNIFVGFFYFLKMRYLIKGNKWSQFRDELMALYHLDRSNI